MGKVPGMALNTGRELPAISFGTGTSFFNRGQAVADIVHKAYQVRPNYQNFPTSTYKVVFIILYR